MANALRGATNGDLDAAGLASLTDALDRHFSSTALESAKVGASAGNLYERNFATLGTQADALQLTEKQIAFGGQNSNNFEHQK